MISFKEALELAKKHAAPELTIKKHYGEVPGKYVFIPQDSYGIVPPGGITITVDKETGKCQLEYLELEGDKPWSPFRNYKKIENPEE